MDGKALLYSLRETLGEDDMGGDLDARTSYNYLYSAATEFVNRTNCLKTTQSITTVAEQAGYTLDADFMKLYLKDSSNDFYLKYSDGTTNHFIKHRDYEDIIYGDQTDSQSIPNHFTIIDDSTKDTQLSGTTTSAGALSGGQATLNDTTADFSDVSAGDIVHNTTDDSNGVVLSKTSSKVLVTAMFDGTDNDWDNADAYVIQPQARLKVVFDPPPSTASHTVTVYYIQRPAPVYSDYGIYRIQSQYQQALVFYACWLYRYRSQEPNMGDRFYQHFDNQIRKASHSLNQAFVRRGFKLNLRGRR